MRMDTGKTTQPTHPPLRPCVCRSKPGAAANGTTAESDPIPETKTKQQVDALLKMYESRKEAAEHLAPPVTKMDPIVQLRTLFKNHLYNTVQSVECQYSEHGVLVQMDASDLINGGRRVLIDIGFKYYGMRLEGTVTNYVIAFQITDFNDGVPGAVRSGPSLRIRGLTPNKFRDFLLDILADIIRYVLHSGSTQ